MAARKPHRCPGLPLPLASLPVQRDQALWPVPCLGKALGVRDAFGGEPCAEAACPGGRERVLSVRGFALRPAAGGCVLWW